MSQSHPKKDRPIWRLKSGEGRRFLSGHPWVFSNELQESPKGIEPGSAVELRDPKGAFLARGYGNPRSLIAFRAMSRDAEASDPMEASFLEAALRQAATLRARLGLREVSHRLVFGEADFIPGLIIDRYHVSQVGQVFVVQAHTAGADSLVRWLPETLEKISDAFYSVAWKDTAIVVRGDMGVRELEGLALEKPRILKSWSAGALGIRPIDVPSASTGKPLALEVDLEAGQKTAFYLDQSSNTRLFAEFLSRGSSSSAEKKSRFRVLDLCCYVGQWSAQIARAFPKGAVEAQLVDSSQAALDLAQKNVSRAGASAEIYKADVIGGLQGLKEKSYDAVIADPPALIKGRKAIGPGKHAYLQLNTDVFRLIRPGGWVASCSCSALLGEEEFAEILGKAARRSGRSVQWVARGGHAPDHPVLAEFPEGRYLKCWVGRVL